MSNNSSLPYILSCYSWSGSTSQAMSAYSNYKSNLNQSLPISLLIPEERKALIIDDNSKENYNDTHSIQENNNSNRNCCATDRKDENLEDFMSKSDKSLSKKKPTLLSSINHISPPSAPTTEFTELQPKKLQDDGNSVSKNEKKESNFSEFKFSSVLENDDNFSDSGEKKSVFHPNVFSNFVKDAVAAEDAENIENSTEDRCLSKSVAADLKMQSMDSCFSHDESFFVSNANSFVLRQAIEASTSSSSVSNINVVVGNVKERAEKESSTLKDNKYVWEKSALDAPNDYNSNEIKENHVISPPYDNNSNSNVTNADSNKNNSLIPKDVGLKNKSAEKQNLLQNCNNNLYFTSWRRNGSTSRKNRDKGKTVVLSLLSYTDTPKELETGPCYYHENNKEWRAKWRENGVARQKTFSARRFGYNTARKTCEWIRDFIDTNGRVPNSTEINLQIEKFLAATTPENEKIPPPKNSINSGKRSTFKREHVSSNRKSNTINLQFKSKMDCLPLQYDYKKAKIRKPRAKRSKKLHVESCNNLYQQNIFASNLNATSYSLKINEQPINNNVDLQIEQTNYLYDTNKAKQLTPQEHKNEEEERMSHPIMCQNTESEYNNSNTCNSNPSSKIRKRGRAKHPLLPSQKNLKRHINASVGNFQASCFSDTKVEYEGLTKQSEEKSTKPYFFNRSSKTYNNNFGDSKSFLEQMEFLSTTLPHDNTDNKKSFVQHNDKNTEKITTSYWGSTKFGDNSNMIYSSENVQNHVNTFFLKEFCQQNINKENYEGKTLDDSEIPQTLEKSLLDYSRRKDNQEIEDETCDKLYKNLEKNQDFYESDNEESLSRLILVDTKSKSLNIDPVSCTLGDNNLQISNLIENSTVSDDRFLYLSKEVIHNIGKATSAPYSDASTHLALAPNVESENEEEDISLRCSFDQNIIAIDSKTESQHEKNFTDAVSSSTFQQSIYENPNLLLIKKDKTPVERMIEKSEENVPAAADYLDVSKCDFIQLQLQLSNLERSIKDNFSNYFLSNLPKCSCEEMLCSCKLQYVYQMVNFLAVATRNQTKAFMHSNIALNAALPPNNDASMELEVTSLLSSSSASLQPNSSAICFCLASLQSVTQSLLYTNVSLVQEMINLLISMSH